MKLRLRVLSPTNTGNPDYTICGQGSSAITLAGTTVNIVIGGTTIFNNTLDNMATVPGGTITTAEGFDVVGLFREDTNYITMEVQLANIWNCTSYQIVVDRVGYLSYANTFTIFGYDLGNNPNQAITGNPNMDIQIIEEANNLVDGNQTKAYTSFVAYRKPFTDRIYITNTNSGQPSFIYLSELDKILLSAPLGYICDKNEVKIKQRHTLEQLIDCVPTIIDTCESVVQTIGVVTNIMDYNASVSCVPCVDDCTSILALNTATTYLDHSLLTTYQVNDLEVYPFTSQELEYTLYDHTGIEVNYQQNTINIGAIPYVHDPATTEFSGWSTDEVGDFLLNIRLSVEGVYYCDKKIKIKSCHFYEIDCIDCNTHRVHNRSFDDLILNISKLNDDKEFELVEEIALVNLSYVDVVSATDGIYKFETVRDNKNLIYIVTVHCNLRNCTFDYLNKLICGCSTDKCKCNKTCKDYYDFNALMLNAYTYLALLNDEYNFNFIYDTISTEKIDELYTLKSFIERFNEYCDSCTDTTPCSC